MKIYDLSQPLNERSSFWPYYPPFEVKYIKRKAEHGVNAQYIMTSNHMGTHLDAPRHLVLLHTGWHRYADFGAPPDDERYYHYHPCAHPDLVPWLLEKKVHVWGVDC